MDAHNKRLARRLVAILVLLPLHGGLVAIFLRKESAQIDQQAATEVPMALSFIDPEPIRELPRPEPAHSAPLPTRHLRRGSHPDVTISPPDTPAPEEATQTIITPRVDWSAEAQRSAADITSHRQPGRPADSSSSSTPSGPWDRRPLLESSSEGLTVRIPIEIPGDIIDHCFVKLAFDHEQTGQSQRLQLGCALGKPQARGDLFDSLRKPSEPSR